MIEISLKPLKGCKHGQRIPTRWWHVSTKLVRLHWTNYGKEYVGRRLWIYTMLGGVHVGFYLRTPWEYGTCCDRVARRHRRERNVQFVLWRAGEQGHAENYWHNFDSSWWPEFKPAEEPK